MALRGACGAIEAWEGAAGVEGVPCGRCGRCRGAGGGEEVDKVCGEMVSARSTRHLCLGFGSRGRQPSRRAAGVARGASTRGVGATSRQVTNRVTRRSGRVAALAAHMTLASVSVVTSALNRAILLGGFSPPIVSMASITSAARRLMQAMCGSPEGPKSMLTRVSPRFVSCSRIAAPITKRIANTAAVHPQARLDFTSGVSQLQTSIRYLPCRGAQMGNLLAPASTAGRPPRAR